MQSSEEVRLISFLSVFLFLSLYEIVAPRRSLTASRGDRWFKNFGIGLINQLVTLIAFPMLAVGVAFHAETSEWGLFNSLSISAWGEIVLCLLILDLIIYVQHRLFHRVSWLWRIHRVHHSDLDFDVTTAIRFHPAEVIASMCIKTSVILVLGASPLAVLLFEIALSLSALFSHSNIRIGRTLDRLLRVFVITPDMHRVHHSTKANETSSNFGFCLSCWDRCLQTYLDQPQLGHSQMDIGLTEHREKTTLTLTKLLLLPFNKS